MKWSLWVRADAWRLGWRRLIGKLTFATRRHSLISLHLIHRRWSQSHHTCHTGQINMAVLSFGRHIQVLVSRRRRWNPTACFLSKRSAVDLFTRVGFCVNGDEQRRTFTHPGGKMAREGRNIDWGKANVSFSGSQGDCQERVRGDGDDSRRNDRNERKLHNKNWGKC